MSLKARVDKLYSGTISTVSSHIIVSKDGKEVKRAEYGNNKHKVIRIVVRL